MSGIERQAPVPTPDVPGALLVTTAIAALIYGLSNGQQHGFGAPASLTALIASVLLMTAFIYIEGHVRGPTLPLAVFSVPARRAAVAAMLMMGAMQTGAAVGPAVIVLAQLRTRRQLEVAAGAK